MKKIRLLLILVFVICLLGCQSAIYYWEFDYDYNQINEIKIIDVLDEFNYKEIKEIDIYLAKEIYDSIKEMKMKRYGTTLFTPSGFSFLIVFNTGEYDIISKKESKHYKYKNSDILAHNSWLCCDESEFERLINKYSNL